MILSQPIGCIGWLFPRSMVLLPVNFLPMLIWFTADWHFIISVKWYVIQHPCTVVIFVAVAHSCNSQVMLAGYRRVLPFLTGILACFCITIVIGILVVVCDCLSTTFLWCGDLSASTPWWMTCGPRVRGAWGVSSTSGERGKEGGLFIAARLCRTDGIKSSHLATSTDLSHRSINVRSVVFLLQLKMVCVMWCYIIFGTAIINIVTDPTQVRV